MKQKKKSLVTGEDARLQAASLLWDSQVERGKGPSSLSLVIELSALFAALSHLRFAHFPACHLHCKKLCFFAPFHV